MFTPQSDYAAARRQELADAIAIEAVRSDIEIYAKTQHIAENGGYWIYSLAEPVPLLETIPKGKARSTAQFVHTEEEAAHGLIVTQRAAEFIRLRGNVFPWRMIDAEGHPGYVRFVDREGRPVDPGVVA